MAESLVWRQAVVKFFVRISSFLDVQGSNKCSKATLSDSREVKTLVSSFLKTAFSEFFFYDFEAIFWF